MVLGVVADHVAAPELGQRGRVEGVLLAADDEERGPDAEPVERGEDAGRVRTRTVVERQRDLALAPAAARDERAVAEHRAHGAVEPSLALGCRRRARRLGRRHANGVDR